MANSILVFIKDPVVVATKNPVNLLISLRDKYRNAQAIITKVRGSMAGAERSNILFGTCSPGAADAVAASFTATLSGAMTATDTVTINGQALTGVASGATANQFVVGVSASVDAASLAAAINAYATTAQKIVGICNATAVGAVVTVTCNLPGVIGNLMTCTKSSTAVTLAGLTSNSPTNGAGGLPVLKSLPFGY